MTTEYDKSFKHILNTLNAVKKTGMPALILWPNSDAGSDGISRGIRNFREKNNNLKFFFI